MTLYHAHTPAEARQLLGDGSDVVVVVPVFNSYDDVVKCYQAFFRHTPAEVPLLVVDDCGWDRRTVDVLESVFSSAPPPHTVVMLKQTSNKGFVLTMNDAFEAAGRADVVILNSDVVVTPDWLPGMRAAAYSTSTVGTATALTNYGTIVSVPHRNRQSNDVPGGLSVDDAGRRVAAGSPRLRPRIPTAIGHCAWIKRAVLDVVGSFDPVFSPGYGEEVDFSQRALAAGFVHVVADDVFVFHRGGGSFGRSTKIDQRKYEHDQIVQGRYPYYLSWVHRVAADENSPLAASLLAARRSILGLHVAVDGMCLGPLPAGTQIVVVETVRALAARDDVASVVLHTPAVVPEYVTEVVGGLAKVTIERSADLTVHPHRLKADVVYRPYQVRAAGELDWLRSLAYRVVVNQLDLIAFHDPAYFAADKVWTDYRELARLTAQTADGLTYLSEHSRADAVADGLLPAGTPQRVVYAGTEHTTLAQVEPVRPAGAVDVQPGFLLCIGVAYHHKNRMFTVKLLERLRADGWTGSLVLVGAEPPYGSSTSAEAEYLLHHPELADSVVTLGMVSEAEKAWLYGNAGLVLYPTISEGFGLVPFEAAHFGVPCLSTRQGSLAEVLPADLPTIDNFEVGPAAELAATLLRDEGAAGKLVDQLLEQGRHFTWARVAERVVEVLWEVTGRPANRTVAIRSERMHGVAHLDEVSFADRAQLKAFDAMVQWFVARPDLRQKLVPAGSQRQQAVRRALEVVRARL
jgi:GT2 family glycosyltransferase/glycosyltransferase involved in cell wall biosynthesis